MGRAISPHQTRSVHGEPHRQALDRHVVDHLIVATLQEGRIDGAEGFHAIGGKPCGEGHRMLLGDADVEGAVGEFLAEHVEPRARGHGGVDGDDLRVDPGVLDQFLGEDLGILRGDRGGLGLLAGHHIELNHRVQLVVGALSRGVALALLGHDVDQDRAVLDLARIFQDRHQGVHVVAVDGADIIEAQLLEEGAAGDHATGVFLRLAGGFLQRLGQNPGHRLAQVAQRLVAAA